MRLENWDHTKFPELKGLAYDKLLDAAYVVKDKVAQRLRGVTKRNISRPAYKKGPYAGEPWTARNAGQLLRSVRVVERKDSMGGGIPPDLTNIRVYVGNELSYYPAIVEFYTPFMRPAWDASQSEIKAIVGLK